MWGIGNDRVYDRTISCHPHCPARRRLPADRHVAARVPRGELAAVVALDRIRRRDVLGGLNHEYQAAA